MTSNTPADQRIRQATTAVVIPADASFPAAVSYPHISDPATATRQTSTDISNYLRSLLDGSARQTVTAEA